MDMDPIRTHARGMTDKPMLTDRGLETRLDQPDHTSYSALTGYRTCPARWAAGRILPDPVHWMDARTLGSLAHRTLETTAGRDGHTPDTRDQWTRAVTHVIDTDRLAEGRDRILPDHVDGHDRHDWTGPVVDKLERFTPPIPLDPAAAEQEITARIWNIPMKGSVDYRDRSGVVFDWKTGRPYPEHPDQLRVYKKLLDAIDVHVTRAADVYVETNRVRDAKLDDETMADTGRRLTGLWDRMRASIDRGVFDYNPGFLCGFCPLANLCPRAGITRANRRFTANALPADTTLVRVATGTMIQPTPGENPFTPVTKNKENNTHMDTTPLQVGESRPYDPTRAGTRINLAGYAAGAIGETITLAVRLAGGHEDWEPRITMALIRAQIRVASLAWPELKLDGKPVTEALDTSTVRDARRILFTLLDTEPIGHADSVDEIISRLKPRCEHARRLMDITRRTLVDNRIDA